MQQTNYSGTQSKQNDRDRESDDDASKSYFYNQDPSGGLRSKSPLIGNSGFAKKMSQQHS